MDQAALLNAFVGGPDRLRSAVTGLSREQMIARPITGRWSVLSGRESLALGAIGRWAR